MSEQVHIPKRENVRAGVPIPMPSWYHMGGRSVLMTCVNGHSHRLDHTIDDNGGVRPSVQCPNCDYHEFVILDGWVPPTEPA